MRTTINLDQQLLREYKEFAARTGKTLGATIEEALREVSSRRTARRREPVTLPSYRPPRGREGLQPGIDLDRMADVLDRLDEPDAAGRR